MINDFVNLFFPLTCCGCGNSLSKHEEMICAWCLSRLPKTGHWKFEENSVYKKLWGRARVEHASAFLYFIKNGIVQEMMHQLKYKGVQDVGSYLGRLYAQELHQTSILSNIDYIIPVPLYKSKERKRGYNQSKAIADGIGEIVQKPVEDKILIKTIHTGSQTNLNRWNRWTNQQEKFELLEFEKFKNKHILLVDDVITTGSTIESCAKLFNTIEGCLVSTVFLASAV